MRPSTLELLEKLDDAFRKQMVPLLDDDHAKARAAILVQLIGHLHQRVRIEGECLWDEYAELRELLADCAPVFPAIEISAAIESAAALISADQYPSMPVLAERNEILRSCLVDVIASLDQLPAETRTVWEARIFGYLRAQLDRDLLLSTSPALGDAAGSAELPLV
jgi:hypothetical protein